MQARILMVSDVKMDVKEPPAKAVAHAGAGGKKGPGGAAGAGGKLGANDKKSGGGKGGKSIKDPSGSVAAKDKVVDAAAKAERAQRESERQQR